MSFIRRIFSKQGEEDYENVLANLVSEIQTRQTKLSEIRLRERRSSLLATLYTLAAWVVYVGLWFQRWLPWRDPIGIIPVVLGPILILFSRRIVQVWYNRKGNAEEKTLKELQKKRRTIVEDIKKKTNYYSTRNLIERYDENSPATTPSRPPRIQQPPSQPQQPKPVLTPKQSPLLQQQPQQPSASPSAGPRLLVPPQPIAAVPSHLYASPIYPSTPPRKQWYDKLADAILGDEDASSPATRYALICQRCFTHNGLVKEGAWEDTQFRCMKCQYLNPSPRSKRLNGGRDSTSPEPSRSSVSPARSDPDSSVADTSIDSAPSPIRKRKSAGRRDVDGEKEDEDQSLMQVDS